MISPSSKGLFHRGYTTGSNALQNVAFTPRLQWGQKLAARLGMNSTDDEAKVLEFLENADPVDIVREQSLLIGWEKTITEGIMMPFGPTIEPYDSPGVFLNDEFSVLMRNAWGNNIELILSATSMENLLWIVGRHDPQTFELLSNFEHYIPRELGIERNTDKSRKYGEMIKNVYYPVLKPTITNFDGIILVRTQQYFEVYL